MLTYLNDGDEKTFPDLTEGIVEGGEWFAIITCCGEFHSIYTMVDDGLAVINQVRDLMSMVGIPEEIQGFVYSRAPVNRPPRGPLYYKWAVWDNGVRYEYARVRDFAIDGRLPRHIAITEMPEQQYNLFELENRCSASVVETICNNHCDGHETLKLVLDILLVVAH